MSARSEHRAARAAGASAALLLLTSAPVLANGRYPASTLVAFDPVDASHLVLSSTFGLLESRDGGKTFLWRCESSIGVMDEQDLVVAITASGSTVTTRIDGIAVISDGCSSMQASELAGKGVVDLALYRSEPHAIAAIATDSRIDAGPGSQVVRSRDDGLTWAPLGPALPSDLEPLTIDPAPSDATRLYVTGRLGGPDQFASALLRSHDGGAVFERTVIPETAQHHLAYIAAVHPTDPDRVYLRVYNPDGTSIFVTDDGGASFRKIFTGTGQLLAFAVSPDGARVAFGGLDDGIWVGASDGTGLTRRSDVRPTCLGWTSDGLFACADAKVDRFSFGRSRDEGMTFEPLFAFSALCGNTGCSAGSATAKTCADDWKAIGPTLGSTCGLDAGAFDAAGPLDAGVDVVENLPDAPGTGRADLVAAGGGCTLAPTSCGEVWGYLLVLSGLWLGRRRTSFPGAKLV